MVAREPIEQHCPATALLHSSHKARYAFRPVRKNEVKIHRSWIRDLLLDETMSV